MSWNYRVVKITRGVDEPYYEVKEVFYDANGSLIGYADAITASGTFEGIVKVLEQMKTDVHKSVIDEEEFYRVNKKEKEIGIEE